MTKGFHQFARKVALAVVFSLIGLAGNGWAQERSQAPDGQGGVTLLDAGMTATCGLRPDGTPLCWGGGKVAQPPMMRFVEVSMGGVIGCGLGADGVASCWGNSSYTGVPAGESFKAVSAGLNFGCGLKTDGALRCWGDNQYGQATAPAGQSFVAITAGQLFACALRSDGTASCWGYNANGQTTPPVGSNFVALSAGAFHACGLRADGAAQCWGGNSSGQTTVPAGQSFASLTVGSSHSCGLRADGVAVCWGDNYSGQRTVPAGQVFIALTAGDVHTCGLRASGVPLCWGDNQNGQRGVTIGETVTAVALGDAFGCAIRRVNGSPVCWGISNYSQSIPPVGETNLTSITAGDAHACARRSDGTAICWGRNDFGQATVPAGQTFLRVVAGGRHTCGLRSDSTVLCWGDNSNGQATAPTGAFQRLDAGLEHTCALKSDGVAVCWGSNALGQTTVPAATTFIRIATGSYFSCGVRTDGTLSCWGSTPPAAAPTGTFWDLDAGRVHVCAQRNDATIQCWGNNFFGQATAPARTFMAPIAGGATSCGIRPGGTDQLVCWGELPLPDDVAGPYGFGSMAAGSTHSCNRAATGRVSCWGFHAYGLPPPPVTTFTEVDLGDDNACGLRTDGAVQCWGSNDSAQSGPPAGPFKTLRMAPYSGCALRPTGAIACWGLNNYGQATPPAGTFRAVDAGYFHSCAVAATGTAQCWGYNSYGQATAPAGLFRDIGVGEYISCGLRMDGTIACWGSEADGAIYAPAGTFNAMAVGRYHACAIRADGSLTCWGWNAYGQATPPASGRYVSVSAGMAHSCAIRDDAVRTCWGSNGVGRDPNLALSPASLPNGVHGTAYPATQFAAAGPNYTSSTLAFGVVAGALPPGMALLYGGLLEGTPTTAGTYTFTAEAEDGNGFTASREYTITITDPTPPVITPSVTGTLGDNGWYRSDVGIAWAVSDAQSAITSSTGCTASTLSTDSPGAGYTCTATSAGGTATQTVTVKRDTTLPTISSGATTLPNAAGWYKAAVTLKYTCSDATSGVVDCPVDDVMSTDGAGLLSPAHSVTDAAGNTRAVVRRTVNIDTVAPESAFDATPPAQSASAQATFAFFATDALSFMDALQCSLDGAAFADCGSPLTLTGLADGAHTFAVRGRDVAGNVDASPATHAWTIDTDDTPPVIAPVVSGTLGDNGWYVGDVTVAWNVSDADSAIASSSGCNTVVLSTDTAAATFTCSASSIGGSASDSVTVKLDQTAPQLVAAPTTAANAAGWYRDDVTVGHACSDALSGVATCPADQVLGGAGSAVTSAARTARDAAGNVSTPATATVKIDRTAPTLAPAVTQPLLLNAVAAAQSNASDGLSGIATQSCTALSTSSVGARTVTCSATDAAGNSASASTGYRVQYGFAGFEAPLGHAWNGVQAKKYLPFAWRVFDANNADVSGITKVTFAKANVTCPAGITPVPLTAYGDANTSLQYLGGGRYRNNWLMPVMQRGCIHLTVDLGDGVPHVLQVKM